MKEELKGGRPRKSFVFLNTTTQTITSYRNKNWHVAKRTFPLPARYGVMLKRVKEGVTPSKKVSNQLCGSIGTTSLCAKTTFKNFKSTKEGSYDS